MSYKAKTKARKPLQTTLGKAPSNKGSAAIDISLIRKPIETSLFGLKQVLGLFETATDEVRNYISYECDLMYECRICRSIFRSLANFILHKREYCKDSFSILSNNSNHPPSCNVVSAKDLEIVSDDSLLSTPVKPMKLRKSTRPERAKKNLDSVLLKLEGKQISEEICADVMSEDCSMKKFEEKQCPEKGLKKGDIALEDVNDNLSCVFQTLIKNTPKEDSNEFIKSEVMEIHSILNNDEVILGPDGKVIKLPVKPDMPGFTLTCPLCKQIFSTKKTLKQHIRYKHNETKEVYLCPEPGCKGNVFSNTWSVYRHLFKVHRKSTMQVKRLRNQVQNSIIMRGDIKVDKKNVQSNVNDENQRFENFELENEFQMCGGCGKRFERRAALNSHSQHCPKRIAAINHSMKENKPEKSSKVQVSSAKAVGSQKRKLFSVVKKPQPKVKEIVFDEKKDLVVAGEVSIEKIVKVDTSVEKKIEEKKDIVNEVIYLDTLHDINNIFEPETMLIEEPECDKVISITPETVLLKVPPLEKPEISPIICEEIYFVSDDEESNNEAIITLETKSQNYINSEELKCLPCNHTFKKLEYLMKHMSSHFKWFNFQCNICLFKSYDKYSCEEHVKKLHPSATDAIKELPQTDILKYSTDFQKLPPISAEAIKKDNVNEDSSDKSKLRDPSVQKMIMEVIFGNMDSSETNTRPIRNRVTPKKDDFVYGEDIQKLVKLNSLDFVYSSARTMKVCPKKRRLGEGDSKDNKF